MRKIICFILGHKWSFIEEEFVAYWEHWVEKLPWHCERCQLINKDTLDKFEFTLRAGITSDIPKRIL